MNRDIFQYAPPWGSENPRVTLHHSHNPALTDLENGALLRAAMLGLRPGDRLLVGGGVYSIAEKVVLSLLGLEEAPIFIEAEAGQTPVITRPDAKQNLLNIGGNQIKSASYLCITGFEFRGGSAGIRVYGGTNIWIDSCEVHQTGEAGITANSVDADHLYITRNEVHHTGGFGEGLYLGGNHGSVILQQSVIAQNHIHHTQGKHGDGIELKQGSFGNLITENVIHDTKYPCLLVYGTGGMKRNIITRNICVNSDEAVMQVQGEAVVKNNLIIGGSIGFLSKDHQGLSTNLEVTHNTIINQGKASVLEDWGGRQLMFFVNNASYSEGSHAVAFNNGAANVVFKGNVLFGSLKNVELGQNIFGLGIGDFINASFDGEKILAYPSEGGALQNAADPVHGELVDILGVLRPVPPSAGCVEVPVRR